MDYEYAVVHEYGREVEITRYERQPVLIRRNRVSRKIDDGVSTVGSLLPDGSAVPALPEKPKVKSEGSIRRASLSFMRLVKTNLYGFGVPVLATLTYGPNMEDIREARKDFNAFARRAGRQFGDQFAYIVVMEFQQRGAVHFHGFFWGLPEGAARTERSTRLVASLWKKGFADLVQTDGHQKLAWYLSKYFTKGLQDHRLWRRRVFVASKNVLRPTVTRDAIIAALELSTEDIRIYEKEYDTLWLGRALQENYLRPENHGNGKSTRSEDGESGSVAVRVS